MKIPKPSAPTLVTCGLLVLLPALAVLQYRWVGQVSQAAEERMQRNLQNAAAQFGDDFEVEVARAFFTVQVGQQTARDGYSERYTDRYTTWLDTAEHPDLVASIFLVDADNGRLRLRRWNRQTHVFDPIEWTAPVDKWRRHFEEELAAFNAGRAIDRGGAFRDELSLFAAPIVNRVTPQTPSPVPQTTTQMFGFTVMELNMPYVRHRMLPELAQRHFSHPDAELDQSADRYRIAVTESDNPRAVLYRSDDAAPTDPTMADVTEALIDRSGSRRRGVGPGMGPGGFGGQGRPAADGQRRGTRESEDGRWRLLVQHQSGSLEAAVARVRRRNLGISFGVLALLSGSIGLLSVNSRRAHRLARQQMEFVAGVSHELRTPVAVIRSAGENLSQGVIGNANRVKQYGQMIEGEARRLGEMVERVLQFAGIESGLGFTARVPLAPAELIEAAITSEVSLADASLHVQREIASDLPPVLGDAAALRSVVQNLLANAVKYGGPDRWIGIRAEHVRERRRSEVRITISDHGAGIPTDELPHIFDPFYRGADAISRQVHGNGLGLSLVQRIVAAHGGRVVVATRPGDGSSFMITLPAVEPQDRPSPVAGESQAPVHS